MNNEDLNQFGVLAIVGEQKINAHAVAGTKLNFTHFVIALFAYAPTLISRFAEWGIMNMPFLLSSTFSVVVYTSKDWVSQALHYAFIIELELMEKK